MHPAKIRAHRRKTVLALTLALGVGLPPPAQAYLLDFTVASINPGVSSLMQVATPRDLLWLEATSRSSTLATIGDPESQPSPTIAPPNKF